VPCQLGGADQARGRQLVARSREQLDGLVEDAGTADAVGELSRGYSDGAERRVDRAGADSLDRRAGVEQCHDVYNPVLATYRLDQTEKDRVARTLSAWSISSSTTIAVFTALWGVLAQPHRPADGNRDRRRADPGDPALAAPPVSAPEPLTKRVRGYSQPSCLTSRKRCTLVAGQHVIISGLISLGRVA